jgi:hypothetical protein
LMSLTNLTPGTQYTSEEQSSLFLCSHQLGRC